MNDQKNATQILQTVLGLLLLVLGVIVVLLGGWGFENETLWDWLKLGTLPAAIAILPLWLTYRGDKPSHCWLVFPVLAFLLMMVAVGGYSWHWEWTGIVPRNEPNGKKPTDLWDWLEVVLVPFTLALVSAWAADRYRKPSSSNEITYPIE